MNNNILKGWICPHCGNEERFYIPIVSWQHSMVTDKGYDYGKNVRETIFDKGVNEATCPKCGFIGGFIEFTNPDNASRIKKGRSMINIHEEQFTKQCALNEVLIDLILCAKEDGLSFREAVENAWRPDKE